jgi:predicted permease
MSAIRSIVSQVQYRWRALFDREALDTELDAELADHLHRETDANIRRGMNAVNARRAARLDFGAVQRYKEESRDARGLRWLDELRHDVRFALRMLAKSPLFTGTVIVTLAIGIGLNTAVFAAIEATLLRPLPGARAPNELVQVYRTYPGDEKFGSNSIPHFRDVRARSSAVFDGVAAWSFTTMSVSASDRPVKVFGNKVSANFFTVLGVNAALGRVFGDAEDEARGASPVAVLSDAGWERLFSRDPRVVGRTLLVNGRQVEVIGVTPPDFHGAMPLVFPVLYMPIQQLTQLQPGAENESENRSNNFMNVIARVRHDVSLDQATARMNAITTELRAEFPDEYQSSGINLVPQSEAGIGPRFRSAQMGLSAVVMIVAGLLLLVACVNVANLFLARANERAREMAIRLSLGARRGLLFRQLMVESLMFSLVAGAAGIALAWWTITLANRISLPIDLDVRPDLHLSPTVLGYSLTITLLTGILFGLVPALQATQPSLIPALKGETPAGGSRLRASRVLVVAQMALSIVLLIGAGLFVMNLRSATTIDKGFVSDHLLVAELDPSSAGYTNTAASDLYRRLGERLASTPAVQSVAFVETLPLGLNGSDGGVSIPGYVPQANENMSIQYAIAGPNYFRTMGVPLSHGREFTSRDDSAAVRVIVVNQRFVDRFWPGQDGIGKSVKVGGRGYTVIGVVSTGKYKSLGEDPTAHIWYAYAQSNTFGMNVVIRTTGDPAAFIGTLRNEVAALDPNLPLSNARTMDSHLGISLMPARLAGGALGLFGVLGLLLASVGMYGVMGYSVAQRSREIGIRMAIGATGAQVVRMIMRQGLTLVLIGTAIGLVGAVLASRLLSGILYGDSALSPVAFGLVPVLLIGVAAVATFVPARRAAAVDPVIALRSD